MRSRGNSLALGGPMPSAASMGWSFQPDSAYSGGGAGIGHDAAAAKEGRRVTVHQRRANADHEFAFPVTVQPADGPGIPAAVEPSHAPGSALERALPGETAHRRALDEDVRLQVQDADARADLPADGRQQVLHVGQPFGARLRG